MQIHQKLIAAKDVPDAVMARISLVSIGNQWAIRFDVCMETYTAYYSDEDEAKKLYNGVNLEEDAYFVVEADKLEKLPKSG